MEPFEGVFAVFDPLDACESEALELALLVPIDGKNPHADLKGSPSGGDVWIGGRAVGAAWARQFTSAEQAAFYIDGNTPEAFTALRAVRAVRE